MQVRVSLEGTGGQAGSLCSEESKRGLISLRVRRTAWRSGSVFAWRG